MAELQGTAPSTTIVKADTRDWGASGPMYSLNIQEWDAAGKSSTLTVPFPQNERWGGILFRAALAKKGGAWKEYDIPTIAYAIVYAEHLGLDFEAGDVYMAAEGRLSTTAGAKIKHAMSTGRVLGIKTDVKEGPAITLQYTAKGKQETWTGPDLSITVTLKVKGWEEPFVYRTKLREWFTGRNPNWRDRTEYMLTQNAISKACAMVAPMGTEADEAPPKD